MTHPILYSLQNCPYAMRARLAILMSQQTVLIRAIVMKNKPAERNRRFFPPRQIMVLNLAA